MQCPKTDDLIDLVFYPDKLGMEATKKIQEHLEKCPGCKAVTLRYKREKQEAEPK
ncbi:MAG: hypothetical protein US31_C0002G0060 [Berkelbacteria bacterium GW2011_GWA1_36_9]|uniref:Zinc-finger domain-containing protein n=1 Tax=Berkelbacteria bacterium GW2011_GWA1_36_9 TaxID=1618331 RepID=A0A0G0FY49_9BACT|nr:MAG: hypothetical protein US31_C0002G0060 [Berkelbacteria bacterium GW2011_GWA1_36_9]